MAVTAGFDTLINPVGVFTISIGETAIPVFLKNLIRSPLRFMARSSFGNTI